MLENEKTLQSYESKVEEYIAGTPSIVSGDMQEWLDKFVGRLPAGSVIFEIGSGTGRDAKYLTEKHSMKMVCSDVPAGFVSRISDSGYECVSFDALKDDFPVVENVKGVLSNAVLHHFSRDDFALILRKVRAFLPQGGEFAFSVKRGSGQEWSDEKLDEPRFFTYWDCPQLLQEAIRAGFMDVELTANDNWVFVICR